MKKTALFASALLLSGSALAGKTPPLPYTYSRLGNADIPAQTPLLGGIVLMGGGTDVDTAFKWMCGRMGNGDFLVLRAAGTNAYNSYVKKLCPNINSVATLIIPDATAAKDARVAAIIRQAEAIWIAGGDQSNYVNYWQGTPVTQALDYLTNAGAPIGGTSAGLNVLTQYVYSATGIAGVTSAQALADPYHEYITFSQDFVTLPVLSGVIGDPHFAARDRMGRDLAFLCRLSKTFGRTNPRGISVDEGTALMIDNAGKGTVANAAKSTGKVYFLQGGTPGTCEQFKPLTYEGVAVYRIGSGGTFNVDNWWNDKSGGTGYTVNARGGVLSSDQPGGSIY